MTNITWTKFRRQAISIRNPLLEFAFFRQGVGDRNGVIIVAASIQVVTEEIVLKMARYAQEITGSYNLCLAGGVVLNCVSNGNLLKEHLFDKLWIQPAAGDAGGALGSGWSL